MAAAPHQWFDSFGDLATWFGSMGTVAAFAVGFWQIHRERQHRLLGEMTERLRSRRSHADHVSAWIHGSELVVANRSGHPIHDVVVALENALIADAGAAERSDSPAGGDGGPASHGSAATVDGPLTIGFVLPGEHSTPVPHPPHVAVLPALTFTDARGDRWHRAPGRPPELVDDRRADRTDDPAAG